VLKAALLTQAVRRHHSDHAFRNMLLAPFVPEHLL